MESITIFSKQVIVASIVLGAQLEELVRLYFVVTEDNRKQEHSGLGNFLLCFHKNVEKLIGHNSKFYPKESPKLYASERKYRSCFVMEDYSKFQRQILCACGFFFFFLPFSTKGSFHLLRTPFSSDVVRHVSDHKTRLY